MIPKHYSYELPERCHRLVEQLWPAASQVMMPGEGHAGPLTTTFLLALATPIINLPYERIQMHQRCAEGYANDTGINQALTERFDEAFKTTLGKADFLQKQMWAYAKWEDTTLNLANALPEKLCDRLCDEVAYKNAANMQVTQWASAVRNALAHGGIVYLNKDGYPTDGNSAAMLCFISGKYDDETGSLKYLNCLRISEANFRTFLSHWVSWMKGELDKVSGQEMTRAKSMQQRRPKQKPNPPDAAIA